MISACANGASFEVVKALLDKGAKVNVDDKVRVA